MQTTVYEKELQMSSTPFNMVSLIRKKKRERQSLTTEEIDYIIKAYTRD